MDVDMMAERIIQMIGFLFLNINNRISKQNNVCIAHMALYVRIFQQFNSNAIQMAYRIFLLDLLFKRLFSNIHNPISKNFRLKIDYTIASSLFYLTPLLERFLSLCSIIKWVRLCIK